MTFCSLALNYRNYKGFFVACGQEGVVTERLRVRSRVDTRQRAHSRPAYSRHISPRGTSVPSAGGIFSTQECVSRNKPSGHGVAEAKYLADFLSLGLNLQQFKVCFCPKCRLVQLARRASLGAKTLHVYQVWQARPHARNPHTRLQYVQVPKKPVLP